MGKFIFTVQGEGRGHLTQAISMTQIAREAGHEVVGYAVGSFGGRKIPSFFSDFIFCFIKNFSFAFIDFDAPRHFISFYIREPSLSRWAPHSIWVELLQAPPCSLTVCARADRGTISTNPTHSVPIGGVRHPAFGQEFIILLRNMHLFHVYLRDNA